MKLSSINISMICALLLSAYAQNASAENRTEPRQNVVSEDVSHHPLYIKLINENEVMIGRKKLTLAELEDYLLDTQSERPEQQTILYISDTQFVNQAYKLAFDLERVTNKHIWVTYKP